MSTAQSDTKELRLAVVGADRRGRISLAAHQPENGSRLVAACSLTPERLGIYRERCGDDVRLTANYRDLLDDASIDAIFVCTPDYLHEEHTVAALEAGKDVYLEKPMAITIEGCDAILAAQQRTGKRVYPGHNMRFFPVMEKMRELAQSGVIGQIQAIWCRHFISYGGDAYFRDWHSEQRYGTGLLLQKGAHDIDMIHWFAASTTKRVTGMGKLSVYDKLPRRAESDPQPGVEFNRNNWPPKATKDYSPKIDVEDHSMLLLELENGVQASYLQCHYTPDDTRNYTIIGTEGRIENYGDHSSAEYHAEVHLWNRRTGYSRQGQEIFTIPPIEGSHGGADPRVVEDFLCFLRTGGSQGATPIEARMATAVGCCGTHSLRNGNIPVDVPPVNLD